MPGGGLRHSASRRAIAGRNDEAHGDRQFDADGGADGFETLVKFGDALASDFTADNLDLIV